MTSNDDEAPAEFEANFRFVVVDRAAFDLVCGDMIAADLVSPNDSISEKIAAIISNIDGFPGWLRFGIERVI